MTAPAAKRVLWLVTASWLTGCSLMNLGDYDIQACEPADAGSCSSRVAPCAKQNADHGITDDDCLVYQCRMDGRGCELGARDADGDGQPDAKTCGKTREDACDCDDCDPARFAGNDEAADRLDNDCNEVIDEDVLSGIATTRPIELGADAWPVELVAFAGQAGSSDPVAGATSGGRAFLTFVAASEGQELRYGNVCSAARKEPVADRCPAAQGASVECDFRRVALTRSGEHLIAAGVSGRQFAKGLLRIGLVNRDLPSLELGAHLSTITLGAGRDPESECCADAEQGVRHPVIAGLEIESAQGAVLPQALAIWTAESSEERPAPSCEAGPSPAKTLEALGVGLRAAHGDVPAELFASDSGRPICVGETSSFDAPALVAWSVAGEQRGFLAGYPNANHALELARFDPLAGQPPDETERDLDALCTSQATLAPSTASCGAEAEPSGLTLADPALCSFDDFGDAVQAVAIAPARSPAASDRAAAFLVAVRRGCGASAEISVSSLELDAASDAGCDAFALGSTITLRAAAADARAQVIAGPAVAYVSEGFISPAEASDDPAGGWFVIWLERDGEQHTLWGARVSERDQRVIDRVPFELTHDISDSPIAISDAQARFFFGGVNQDTAAPVLGSIYNVNP